MLRGLSVLACAPTGLIQAHWLFSLTHVEKSLAQLQFCNLSLTYKAH